MIDIKDVEKIYDMEFLDKDSRKLVEAMKHSKFKEDVMNLLFHKDMRIERLNRRLNREYEEDYYNGCM